ncbi:MAG: dihydroorotase [Deltaproteobacteria bacterium]
MRAILKNGRVIDPASGRDGAGDIAIENGRICRPSGQAEEIIDCRGMIVAPGLVDMHVHLREPGREDKETVESGTAAAVRGGVTTVLAMANTQPAMDSPETVQLLKEIIRKTARSRVAVCAAITMNRIGKELVDVARLRKEGVVAISDDGVSVESAELMRKALRKARESKVAVLCHCEDPALSSGGVMNLGFVSTKLGLRGIPAESEYRRIQRDIELAEKEKAAVHICHVSCAESIELIQKAKKKGIKVTCETAPHYFTLTEEDLFDYDTRLKMNPPLRCVRDRDAVIQALAKGTIDVIASDHAPHTIGEKDIEFDRAEFGVIGLETELAVSATALVGTGIIGWPELIRKLSLNPARILGLDAGTLAVGAPADIVVIDPEREWAVRKEEFLSASRNSPFIGRTVKGRVEYTIVNGSVVYKAGA